MPILSPELFRIYPFVFKMRIFHMLAKKLFY